MLLCVLVIKIKTLSHLHFFVPGPQVLLQPKSSYSGAQTRDSGLFRFSITLC